MCIAVPMEILEIDEANNAGRVLFSGNEIGVNLTLVSTKAKVGDYVLVHAGCAIEIVNKESAEEILDIFKILEDS